VVAARDHGLAVDDAVLVGSPGAGVDHARELGLPEGSVWATTADNDIIGHAYDAGDLRAPVHPLVPTGVPNPDPDLVHGNDPTDPDFGARVFGSDPRHPDLAGSASRPHRVLGEEVDIVAELRADHRGPRRPGDP
jgi:hypothetical protein